MAFNCYMHERNIYRNRPDFGQIALDFPFFRQFAIPDSKGKFRVDFTNPDALRMLTEILLKKDFNLDIQIPQGFLIPTVPQRLNYILWIEDILGSISQRNEKVTGIDIGTGPCAIFSVLGTKKNGWNFIATESSDSALEWAKRNIEKNNLTSSINVVKVSPDDTLSKILSINDSCYEFCMCNPPFFENSEEIRRKHPHSSTTIADIAQRNEIFFKGGEVDFVRNLLKESLMYKNRVCLFTSMFGKKKSFFEILEELKKIEQVKVTTTEFCQGNTIRWGIAWSFDPSVQFTEVKLKKTKPKTSKQPLKYEIPTKKAEKDLQKFVNKAKCILKELEIPFTTTKSSKQFIELTLKSEKNTWTHLRRKRRELERQTKCEKNSVNELFSSNGNATTVKSVADDGINVERNCNDLTDISQNESNNHHCSMENKCVTDLNETNLKHNSHNCSDEVNNSELPQEIKKRKLTFEDSHMSKKTKLDTEVKIESPEMDKNSDKEIVSLTSTCDELEINNFCNNSTTSSEQLKKVERNESSTENESTCLEKDLLLHCYLRLNVGKKKIYVNMNCPPIANRNSMYQVFQVLKNKLK